MNDCNETIKDLYPYLDDELPADVRAHVHDHLHGCSGCLEAFDFEAELKAAIRRKCQTDSLPPGLVARIEACFQMTVVDDTSTVSSTLEVETFTTLDTDPDITDDKL